MEYTARKREMISLNEVIIIIALVFSPFTALRFSFFGIAEILFIVFCVIYFYRKNGVFLISDESAGKYYVDFVVVTLAGWGFNFVSGINSGTVRSAIFNLASYVFSGVSIICVECLLQDEDTDIRASFILKVFFFLLGIISIGLYIISLGQNSLFGFTLKYYQYFCPLCNNLHQYAMVIVPLPFLGGYFVSCEKSWIKKILYTVLSLAFAYLASSTGSDKAKIGLVAGGIVLVVLFAINKITDNYLRFVFSLTCILSIIAYVVLFHEKVYSGAVSFFTDMDNGGSREYLYKNAIRIISTKSPIIGLGPSVHVTIRSGELYDAHETFLAAGLSGGLIGIGLIMAFMVAIARKAICNCYLFAAMVPIFVYALGGDLLRKIPVWIIFLLLAYAAEEGKTIGSPLEVVSSKYIIC